MIFIKVSLVPVPPCDFSSDFSPNSIFGSNSVYSTTGDETFGRLVFGVGRGMCSISRISNSLSDMIDWFQENA